MKEKMVKWFSIISVFLGIAVMSFARSSERAEHIVSLLFCFAVPTGLVILWVDARKKEKTFKERYIDRRTDSQDDNE